MTRPAECNRQALTIDQDEIITQAIKGNAHVVFSLSGGKDSSAAPFEVNAWLDSIGHPRTHRHAIHADLGTIEWPSTGSFVESVAKRLNVPLHVVARKAGGLIERWEERWASATRRYENLETYQLVSPFSSARLRFCTSETKVAPIGSFLKSRFTGKTVISVVGIRRDESLGRANAPLIKTDTRFAPVGNRAGSLAALRREAEAMLPQGLRFHKGWPPRLPTKAEAATIATVRSRLIGSLGLNNRYTSGADIQERFAELHARQSA